MKRKLSLLLILVIIFSLTGCKKDVEETISENNEVISENENNENVDSDNSNPQEEDSETSNNDTESEIDTDTVQEDVYGDDNLIAVNDDLENSNGEATVVTDNELISEIEKFIEKFYYNYLFEEDFETGEITTSAMQLFAISYIYQYEYNELRFDAQTFTLYIPEDNVSEVISRFFDYDFIDHKYPDNTLVAYEDGYYLMPAVDIKDKEPFELIEISKVSDFEYLVLIEEMEEFKSVDAPTIYYEALIEERNGEFILENYKGISVEPVSDTETEENTEE